MIFNNNAATLLVLTYNHESFIKEAIISAFNQTYEPLQIIISDDCSKDRTFEIIEETVAEYTGPHQVIAQRLSKNLGLVEHVNKLMEMATGRFIAFAAGDDISLPRRVETSVKILESDPTLMSISLGLIKGTSIRLIIEENSAENVVNVKKFSIEDFCSSTTVHANSPARTIKAEVYSKFGPLNNDCQVEDQPLLFRALLLGEIGICDVDGVFYRVHGGNMSAGAVNTSFNFQKIYQNCIDDTMLASEREYIPKSKVRGIILAIKRRQERDELWRGYKNSPRKLFFFIFKILPSSVIPMKGKLRRLKELALG